MANVQKEVNKLQKEFATLVVKNNGSVNVRKSRSGVRIDYRIGEKEAYYKWHSSLSDANSVKLLKNNLYKVADQLGISRDHSREAIGFAVRVDQQLAWDEWVHESNKIFLDIAEKLTSADRPI